MTQRETAIALARRLVDTINVFSAECKRKNEPFGYDTLMLVLRSMETAIADKASSIEGVTSRFFKGAGLMKSLKLDRLLLALTALCLPFTLLSFVQSVASDGDWHGWLGALIWNTVTLLEKIDKIEK